MQQLFFKSLLLSAILIGVSCTPPTPFVTPYSEREGTISGVAAKSSAPSKSEESLDGSIKSNKNSAHDLPNSNPLKTEALRPQSRVIDSSPPDTQGDVEAIGLNNYPEDKGFEVEQEFWLDLSAPKMVEFSPKLVKDKENFDGFISVERKDENVRFKILFPERGTFDLTIWAKGQDSQRFEGFVAYQITATQGTKKKSEQKDTI